MTTGQPANMGTMPCPDSLQPIAEMNAGRIMVDPVWYRFFRSPQFLALSTGGAAGGSTAAKQQTPPPAAVLTTSTGVTNTQFAAEVAVIEAQISKIAGTPGPAGAPGSTGPAGPAGSAGMQFMVDTDQGEPAPAFFSTPAPAPTFAGGFTASTTINDTVTPTSGGATLGAIALAGSVWRIRAHGQFVAALSATARNAQVSPFWGSTALPQIAVAVLTGTAQTTNWELEFIASGSSSTAVWTTGFFTGEIASSTLLQTSGATPASTTVTAGQQALDLRFSMSVAIATDQWIVQNVTMERLR